MAAEHAVGSTTKLKPVPDNTLCSALLAAGASKEAVCLRGLSAAGAVLRAERNGRDFSETFGIPYTANLSSLKKLLLPAGGFTPADLQHQ